MNKTHKFLLVMLLMILSLACSITMTPNVDLTEATAVALEATQVALEMKIIELQQQQTAIAEQPTQPEAEAHAAPLNGQEMVFEDIRFVYPPSVAASVNANNIALIADELIGTTPEHVEFTFNSYAWNGSMHTPILYVYPTDAYRAANQYVGEDIDKLNTLLYERPADPESIPFLPAWNAGQMFASNVKYMEFENGIGVRFLTQYGQDVSPANNYGLFYTFQGLTNDGKWYVSAVFPASHPSLPVDGSEVPNGDWETFSNNYMTYLDQTKIMLNNEANESFIPNLNALDGIIASLRVK